MTQRETGRGGPAFRRAPLQDRRTFLHTLYGATLGALLAACGSSDADVFAAERGSAAVGGGDAASAGDAAGGATEQTLRVQTETTQGAVGDSGSSSSSEAMEGETASTSTTSNSGETTAAESSTTAATTTSSSGGGSGGALPAGGTMVVSFTYEQGPSGKNVPPYIAVWIEDGSGNLLTTVALWYQQFGRGERWLPDLTRWYNVDQTRISGGGADTVDAISGPTRFPGRYDVAWDGTVNGSTAPAGSYFVCIESARERGPYSLIRQSVNLGGTAQQQSLSSDGELIDASLSVDA